MSAPPAAGRATPPQAIALYVHLPWCARKCPYCDFNSHPQHGPLPERDYVQALLRDIDGEAAAAGSRPVSSIFFGGGTPSVFSARAIGAVLDGIAGAFPLTEGLEVTLEANPGSADADNFAAYLAAGVNRLSLGVQSFEDAALRRIGRIHDGAQAQAAYRFARKVGFGNVNLDLMYGLPGQTQGKAMADVARAIALAPDHVSWYQLTIEPNTAFYAAPPSLPGEEAIDTTEAEGRARLAAAGYERYEVSAYARGGKACRHNLNYWTFGDYLGVGAGAHSKLTQPSGRVERRWKVRHPKRYMHSAGSAAGRTVEPLEADALLEDFFLNALRLVQGVNAALLEQRTGVPAAALAAVLERAREAGLLMRNAERLQPSARGLRFVNDLVLLLSAH